MCGFAAVQAVLAGKSNSATKPPSSATGGYCRARQRLALAQIEALHQSAANRIQSLLPPAPNWYGHPVKVVDGSSVSMPDTPQNQARYPQPKNQRAGCGFPVMRLVAVFSLGTGLLLHLAKGSLSVAERTLFGTLREHLKPGDVVLADRGFCSYADFYLLGRRGVECVMRNHQRRVKGIVEIKRLGKNDRLVDWIKMKPCPVGWAKDEWDTVPPTLRVREITVPVDIPGFRSHTIVIATTLLDSKKYPASAFAELYRARWRAELYLRDIKIALGMDVLRCKSPDMVEKELAMHLIAYNLVRTLMVKAAKTRDLSAHEISFTASLDTVRTWAPRLAVTLSARKRQRLFARLLQCIAQHPLPKRPNRVEPRARKRRPKNYQLLNKPRADFKEIHHRNRYTKPK